MCISLISNEVKHHLCAMTIQVHYFEQLCIICLYFNGFVCISYYLLGALIQVPASLSVTCVINTFFPYNLILLFFIVYEF